MWAWGVILFILLSGSPPFYGRTHPDIFARIKQGRWGFNGRNWGQVSEGAKDLVRKMLTQDPAARITAEGVLQHPWIRQHEALSSAHLGGALDDLSKYNARQKFKAAALACIAGSRLSRAVMSKAPDRLDDLLDTSVFTPQELEKIKAHFAAEVAGGKGTLNLEGFQAIMTKLELAHLPLERIFKVFDADGTGDVDYREFLLGISKFRLTGQEAVKCELVFRGVDRVRGHSAAPSPALGRWHV